MFGLEDQSKNQNEKFSFDLEQDLKSPGKAKKMRETVHEQMQKLKEILRSGDCQDDFQDLGTILHGYVSLLKVISRIEEKK